MKKYYLHNGTESSGPFDIEELKAKNITKANPVWFEGMEHWKTAGEIPELTKLFIVTPPPFTPVSIPETEPKVETKSGIRKILGLSKNAFIITCVALIVLAGITVLNTIQDNRSRELRVKNHNTEVENYQLELKQNELEEQKIQDVIQEKIDTERLARLKKQSANNRLSEIEKLLANYQNNLDATERKLYDASGFILLRTEEEKKEQMEVLQKNIDFYKNEMTQLKNEADQLKLELEKIPK